MLEVILDTETTGLSITEKHRIVEIGCIELENQIPTNKIFHEYLNPQRSVSEDAYKIHGYSDDFLSDKKTFSEIAESFLKFIKDKKIIIHNAAFDLSFLNYELKLCKKNEIKSKDVIDTMELARLKFPGSHISLDALCKRFKIDNSKRSTQKDFLCIITYLAYRWERQTCPAILYLPIIRQCNECWVLHNVIGLAKRDTRRRFWVKHLKFTACLSGKVMKEIVYLSTVIGCLFKHHHYAHTRQPFVFAGGVLQEFLQNRQG